MGFDELTQTALGFRITGFVIMVIAVAMAVMAMAMAMMAMVMVATVAMAMTRMSSVVILALIHWPRNIMVMVLGMRYC